MSQPAKEESSPHFRDYPDGAYVAAAPLDDVSGAGRADGPGPLGAALPRPVCEPRTPANPYPIRMFADIGCDFALWGDIDEPPPTRRPGVGECDTLEEELPISDGLRDALLAWAEDYYRWDGGDKTIPMGDFDERGFRLSRQLQRELGELYTVSYSFEFVGPHRKALRASVANDLLPGWTCQR